MNQLHLLFESFYKNHTVFNSKSFYKSIDSLFKLENDSLKTQNIWL
jgi:hypothetical protein